MRGVAGPTANHLVCKTAIVGLVAVDLVVVILMIRATAK